MIPTGSTSTMLQVGGRRFSPNAAITFLLDGQPAPGAQPVQSEAHGNFHADLTITAGWSFEAHRLAARDARGKTAQQRVAVTIVPPGEANTPGPNGAPPNDASFTITITILNGSSPHLPGNPQNLVLVMGRPDPAAGTVCGPMDDGPPHSYPDPNNAGVTDTTTTTCSISYKGGKLIYMRMVLQFGFTGSGGTCSTTAEAPWMYHLEGLFTSPTSLSGMGTMSHGTEPSTCLGMAGSVLPVNETSTWTGTLNTAP